MAALHLLPQRRLALRRLGVPTLELCAVCTSRRLERRLGGERLLERRLELCLSRRAHLERRLELGHARVLLALGGRLRPRRRLLRLEELLLQLLHLNRVLPLRGRGLLGVLALDRRLVLRALLAQPSDLHLVPRLEQLLLAAHRLAARHLLALLARELDAQLLEQPAQLGSSRRLGVACLNLLAQPHLLVLERLAHLLLARSDLAVRLELRDHRLTKPLKL